MRVICLAQVSVVGSLLPISGQARLPWCPFAMQALEAVYLARSGWSSEPARDCFAALLLPYCNRESH